MTGLPFLLFLFVLLFFFPFLIIPVLIFFGFAILFLLPYVVVFNSFYNVITIPWQIIKIAADKRVRKNHSLEHATVNVLEERYGRNLRVGGLAYANGFTLSGPDLPSPYEVLDAVREGHYRMINGEKDLALHPRCGTSIAAANFLFSLLFIIVLFSAHRFTIINIIIAFLVASLIAKPFGLLLQRIFTTYTKVDDVRIIDIYEKYPRMGFSFEIMINPNRTYFIRTVSGNNRWFF